MKITAEILTGLPIYPWLICFYLQKKLVGEERAYATIAQRSSRWAGVVGEYRRRMLYRQLIAKMGSGVVISFGAILTKSSVNLGDNVYIGAYSLLGDVRVGDDVLIADHVCVPSGPHQHGIDKLDVPVREQIGEPMTIHIGCDSWIGSGAILLVNVGEHCVVGAGSVVTKPVEDYKIVAGNPAVVIGDRRERASEK